MSNRVTTTGVKSRGRESVNVVRLDGADVGLLVKWPNTRSCSHPWKAYAGVGAAAHLLGCFYEEQGGRGAALDAILAAR